MADRRYALVIAVLSTVGLVLGWRLFWFLTDDAFISFRYISNSVAGHGYVWNAAPFRPVEGYTSFGWVVLLDLVWRVTGIEPPQAANPLALAFAFGQLVLVQKMLWRMPLRTEVQRLRPVFVALALVGLLTNRTFLAWTSSGLETAMFNFAVLWWIYVAVWRRETSQYWLAELVGTALLVALTRPDGLLFMAATVAVVALGIVDLEPAMRRRTAALVSAGALVLVGYLAWRYRTYSSFLPNTFYAKVTRHWPEAGIRYLASFVLEYALAWWLVAIAAAATVSIRGDLHTRRGLPSLGALRRFAIAAAPAATLVAHVGYYTLVVGGDHFEFRAFSHVLPLVFVTMVWALGTVRWRPRATVVVLCAFVVSSWIVPWTHWLGTRHLQTRDETRVLKYAVAPDLPVGLRWYGRWFDELQFYLIDRMICTRHQEHKTFFEHKVATLPPREIGEHITADDFPVHDAMEVGYVAWVLPNVAIIDHFGLNDYYVARNLENTAERMAHSRTPPPGYVAAFSPNVFVKEGGWTKVPRKHPLSADDVRRIERRYDVWLASLR
jgi:arabinofuranosyltransferase